MFNQLLTRMTNIIVYPEYVRLIISLLAWQKWKPDKNDVLVFVHIPKTAGSVFFDKMKQRSSKSLK